MKPTPDDCSDETINALYDEMKSAEAMAKVIDRVNEIFKAPEIDLRGKNLDVRYEYQGDRVGWSAIDFNSYDGGEFNHIGYGPEKEDALQDLIEKIGTEAALDSKSAEIEQQVDDALDCGDFDTDLEPQ